MVFPHNEAVANATHKTRKRKSSTKTGVTKKKGPATTTSTSTADTRSTRCGLNLFLLFTTLSFTITSPIHVSYFVYKIRNWIQWPSSCPSGVPCTSSSWHWVPWSHRTDSAYTKEEMCRQEKAYTKEGSSCSTQPIQPSFKYQKQEATSAWIKCDSSVLFWEYFYEFLLACAVLMVWRNYFFCYDVSCHGHVL